jgi:Uncharacterized conserved protein (some members contain a von Willebrand factor type A (vWA) domain)
MKNKYSGSPKFSVTRNFYIYLAVLVFALIFTQALRSPISSMMFKFLLVLPIFSFLYSLAGLAAIKVYVTSETAVTEKYAPLEYEFRIINASPLPFPFLDTVISLPQKDGVRCEESLYGISLLPGGMYPLGNKTSFKYRGVYEIGVSCIFIYDFFKMFRIRLDVDIFNNIIVLPRRLGMDRPGITSATDIPTDMMRIVKGTDPSEIGNIRNYANGDPLKNIHWKLSSKTQDLQVKDYTTNTGRRVYVICDFAKGDFAAVADDTADKKTAVKKAKIKKRTPKVKLPPKEKTIDDYIDQADDSGAEDTADSNIAGDEIIADTAPAYEESAFDFVKANRVSDEFLSDMDEFCADGVVELAAAAVYNELRAGNDCTLLYFDSRADNLIALHDFSTVNDFDTAFKLFATTPICNHANSVMRLSSLIGESLNVTIRIVTSAMDAGAVADYSSMPSMFGGSGTGCVTEIVLFNPEERYSDIPSRRDYVDLCKSRLAQNGVILTEIRTDKIDADGHIII